MLNRFGAIRYRLLNAAAVGFLFLLTSGCSPPAENETGSADELFRTDPPSELETREPDWLVANTPRAFDFPDDHAAHDDYRIEWWYYTGSLTTDIGRRFGYQLTFFRTGLRKEPTNPSAWAVRDLYTAHFAISDISEKQHYCFQRNSRRGVGQAGAATDRFSVWNGNWSVHLTDDNHRLQAADDSIELDLQLVSGKPPVLHGEDGLSRKGATPGNASYYYSLTRLPTRGTIRIGDDTFVVSGDSWMDHEFSTSFLEPGQMGWDWFAIQLDNGQDLMLYRMRLDDGTQDPHSSGSLVSAAGQVQRLDADDFLIQPRRSWTSPATGAEYPLHWEITIPTQDINLRVRPEFESQEMATTQTTGISYWEGAIQISGTADSKSVTGKGYMELTGYVGQGLGSLFE